MHPATESAYRSPDSKRALEDQVKGLQEALQSVQGAVANHDRHFGARLAKLEQETAGAKEAQDSQRDEFEGAVTIFVALFALAVLVGMFVVACSAAYDGNLVLAAKVVGVAIAWTFASRRVLTGRWA